MYIKWFSKDKYKACLVTKGYDQKEGIVYKETFASIVKMKTFWMVISIAAHFIWKVYQMDVKSAFMNGYMEDVYMAQPQWF